MRTRNVLLVVMILSVLGFVAHAEMVVTTADGNGADTFVGNDTNKPPTYNYGDYNDMDIRYLIDTRAHIGYMRLDITDIGGVDPTGALLQFYCNYAQSTRDFDVYGLNDSTLDDNWDEMSITYNTAPGLLPTDPEANGNYIVDETKLTLLGTMNVTAGAGLKVSDTTALDLESFIKEDTNNLVTLVLIGPNDGGGRQLYVDTKEGALVSEDSNSVPPSLVLPIDADPFWATTPNPLMNEVVSGSLTQLCWVNPEPNEVGGTIICDVYFGTTEPNALESDYGLEYTLVTGTTDTCVTLPVAPTPLTQYYWVVDVHDSTQPGITHRGRAWSYNTFNVAPTVDAGEDQYVWLTKEIVSTGSDADTMVRLGNGTNNGGATELEIISGGDRVGYIRFDLSALSDLGPGQIESASITLTKVAGWTRNDTITTGRFALVGLDNIAGNTAQDWDESVLSGANVGLEFLGGGAEAFDLNKVTNLDADDVGVNTTETIVGNPDAWDEGTTVTVTGDDLITFLQERIDDDGLLTFMAQFSEDWNGKGFWLAPKEHPTEVYRPNLTITYVVDGTPNGGDAEVTLDGTVTDDGQPYGTLGYLWEQISGPETVSIDPDDTEDVTVSIGTPGWYEFQLTGDDGAEAVSDTVQVYVGVDSCDAAQNVPDYEPYQSDFNNDCVVDLKDFATIASEWLLCDSLECLPL